MATVQGNTLAATKLRPPAPPTRLVDRARLDAFLDDGIRREVPLILVSAPAGSGKSTLVAAWAAAQRRPVAWLQVEDADSDPASFWSSLVAAIGRGREHIAVEVAPRVVGSMGDDRVVVPALVNALEADSEAIVIVVDDYHLVESEGVHRGMERLVELCPAHVTVVIATRVDPPFRLARMRVRQRLSEIRATDLRFDVGEAGALLGPVGTALSAHRLDELCDRTEGWAAGLVLAGLSLEQSADPDQFVRTFRGDDQLVVSYLGDELLATLGAGDRERLLQTAILDRLTGPLVDAVSASSDGSAWLTRMANGNQLIVRLDSTGEWFRYHHLLHDLLAMEARRSFPDRLAELHARAARWYAAEGDHSRAVSHYISAGEPDEAMTVMRIVGPDLLGRGQVKTLRAILEQLGPAATRTPVGALAWGWCEYLAARYDAAQSWLDVMHEIAPPSMDRTVATPLAINVALGRGDVSTALHAARRVTAADDLRRRPAELATAVGAAFTWAGMNGDARTALSIAVTRALEEERFTAHQLALVSIAIVEIEDGNAAAAHAAADHAVSTAEAYGLSRYHGVAPAFAVRARTASDPDAARTDSVHAVRLARRATTDLGLAYVLITCGDTLIDLGDDGGADLLAEARTLIDRTVDPGIAGEYLRRAEVRHRIGTSAPMPVAELVEQLTERELAVLRYLPTALSQRDISAELYVSLNTVKTHCGAIFRKLGVSDRKSAVQAARRLGLL